MSLRVWKTPGPEEDPGEAEPEPLAALGFRGAAAGTVGGAVHFLQGARELLALGGWLLGGSLF